MNTLWLTGAFSDKEHAITCASTYNAILLTSINSQTSHLPFAALVLATTDAISEFQAVADVGCYLVTERTIKHRPIRDLTQDTQPGVLGVFTMVANPALGAAASDMHWRDNHAQLALETHEAMTHYYQLSVQHCFHGPEWNGFALCCFATEDDLRQRFFNSPEGERAITKDVAKFADTRRSPRRVIATLSLKD